MDIISQRKAYETFIGPNSSYYLQKFTHFDQLGDGLHASWNWAAWIGPAWALYRKMYGWFFAMWFITAILSGFAKVTGHPFIVIVPMMAFSAFANSLYYRHVKIKIAQAKKGGVNTWVPWVAASLPVIGILAAIIIPAMAPKAAVPAVAPQVKVNPFDEFDLVKAAPTKPAVAEPPVTESTVHPLTRAWFDRNPWFNSPAFADATAKARAIDKQMADEGWDVELHASRYFNELDLRLNAAGIKFTPTKPGLFDDVLAPAAVKKPLDFSHAKRIGDVPENWTPTPQVNPFLTPPAPAIHPAFQAWKDRNPWFLSPAYVQATRRTIATYKQMIVEGYRFGDGNFFNELDERLLKTGITKS